MSDFIENLLWSLVNRYFFTDFFAKSLLDGAYGSEEQRNLLEFSVVESFGKYLIGGLFIVVVEDDQFVDGDVELFQGVELFLVVGEVEEDVPPDFVQLAHMVDFRNYVLEGQVFDGRGFGSLLFLPFVFLLLLCRACLFLLLLLHLRSLLFFHSPSGWLFLQSYPKLVQHNRQDIFGVQ